MEMDTRGRLMAGVAERLEFPPVVAGHGSAVVVAKVESAKSAGVPILAAPMVS